MIFTRLLPAKSPSFGVLENLKGGVAELALVLDEPEEVEAVVEPEEEFEEGVELELEDDVVDPDEDPAELVEDDVPELELPEPSEVELPSDGKISFIDFSSSATESAS